MENGPSQCVGSAPLRCQPTFGSGLALNDVVCPVITIRLLEPCQIRDLYGLDFDIFDISFFFKYDF